MSLVSGLRFENHVLADVPAGVRRWAPTVFGRAGVRVVRVLAGLCRVRRRCVRRRFGVASAGVLHVGSQAVTVRVASLAEILALRQEELRPGLPPEDARFDGDDEPATRHVGAFLDETRENVACASFMARPWQGDPAYQLRGMATRAELVRRGLGTALLRFAEPLLRTSGTRLLWCNARVGALGFYERLGWTVTSEEFDIPGVGPHRRLVRRVA